MKSGDNIFVPLPPWNPGWVPYQMQENCDPSKPTKTTKLNYQVGQCTIPVDIVAYCKEPFGSNVKLRTDRPLIMPMVVTAAPDQSGTIPGIHRMVHPFGVGLFDQYPLTRKCSGWYGHDINRVFDPTYDLNADKHAWAKDKEQW